VSKPPAKTAAAKKKAAAKTPSKKAAVKAAPAKPKAAAKPKAKVAVKPSPKPAAKPAPKPAAKVPVKTPAKAPVKAPIKPAAKAAPKAVAKPAPKPVPKPAAKAVIPHTPPKALPKAAAKPAPTPTHHPLPKTETKATSKSSSRAAALAPTPPLPIPSNRFTDRFAPASPAKKAEHVPMEPVKAAVKVDPKVANAWKTKAGRELTEAELLAMPEAEYMKDKQLDFFRARLQQQKSDLLSNAGETTEHLREDTTIVPDPADRATIEEEHALELRTRDRERKLLKKVAQSLARLETGEYGYCDETGEPIGLARLLARPTASLSLEAQQRREMKQKMFGN
jgi:DnaK suppressor protein